MEQKQRTPVACGFFDFDDCLYNGQGFHDHIKICVREGVYPRIVESVALPALRAYEARKGAKAKDAFIWQQVKAYHDAQPNVDGGRLRGVLVRDIVATSEMFVDECGERLNVFPRALMQASREAGHALAIISGTTQQVVEAFAKRNGIQHVFGTRHPHENGVCTGGKAELWMRKKADAIDLVVAEVVGDLRSSFAIGDTMSDVPMLESVGYPICFRPNQVQFYELARKNRWPVVFETEGGVITFQRANRRGRFIEVPLEDVVPPSLVQRVTELLAAHAA